MVPQPKRRPKHLPVAGALTAPLGAAGERQYLEHICEGAAVGGLGDKNTLATEEDHEGNGNADRGDQVPREEAHVLLDVSNAP